MKIEVQMVHPVEARTTIGEDQKITIEPLFRMSSELKPIFYAAVTAGRGPKLARKFAICVSAKTGKLICQEINEVKASFDEDAELNTEVKLESKPEHNKSDERTGV